MHSPIHRRTFLQTLGLGTMGATLGALQPSWATVARGVDPIHITRIESVRFAEVPWMWVRLHTDRGLVGTGETYTRDNAQEGALADFADQLLGRDAWHVERIWNDMYRQAAYNVTGGAEMRIISAVNIALYDILGQALDVPVYQLIGGRVQDGIPVYQTARGRIKDGWTNEEHIEEIVQFLYDRGIEGIKIWPFDATGRELGGAHITPMQIEENLDGVRRIRNTLGKNMEIALEFHSLWSLPDAMDIARALEPYDIMWLEDMLLQGNMASYATLARETSIPVVVSERLATRYQYREVLEEKGCDIAMFDVTWCGGITAAKRIAELADTYYMPSAPHTHGGPILWLASIHLAIALRNLYIMESTYHHYTHQFPNYIADYPVPEEGIVQPTDQPGLGLNVQPNLFERADVAVTEIGRV